jgi:hypothetical protein
MANPRQHVTALQDSSVRPLPANYAAAAILAVIIYFQRLTSSRFYPDGVGFFSRIPSNPTLIGPHSRLTYAMTQLDFDRDALYKRV